MLDLGSALTDTNRPCNCYRHRRYWSPAPATGHRPPATGHDKISLPPNAGKEQEAMPLALQS